jgi:chromosome segregation ATPase
MAVVASEVLSRLEALQAAYAKASQSFAVAQSQYEQAQAILTKAEQALRDLGIDPENAEAQLAQELAALSDQITECDQQIAERIESYKAIQADFQKIGV